LAKTIERLLTLRRNNGTNVAVQFFSCFISHSHRDQPFCDKLYDHLRPLEIQLWYSPKDMRGGRTIDDQVRRAILGYDRLLVVLSEHSLRSNWVQTEVLSAKRRETETGQRVLFPIRLVDYAAIQRWSLIDSDTGVDVAREIRRYFIPDFSTWSSQESFQESLRRLVEDLKREELAAATKERVPEPVAQSTDTTFGQQLSALVHDLRNPLASIRNAIALMKEMPNDPEVMSFCQRILERGNSESIEVTDKILELSRSMRRAEKAQGHSGCSSTTPLV
jgi:signal transduction histidine kinase